MEKLRKRKESSKTCDETSPFVQVQPEGGWGWVVCFTSMIVFGVFNATFNTFGILYVEMVKQFADEDPENGFKMSMVGSFANGLSFLMCSAAGVVSDHFGLRQVSVAGGVLAFVGMLSSAFVQDLELLYLTYGVCIGVGFAFPYNASVVIRGHYFKKRLGVVSGIATFGSCAFTTIYSLVIPALVGSVGLQFTLLSLSGLHFILIPCALTWKPRFSSSTANEVTECNSEARETLKTIFTEIGTTVGNKNSDNVKSGNRTDPNENENRATLSVDNQAFEKDGKENEDAENSLKVGCQIPLTIDMEESQPWACLDKQQQVCESNDEKNNGEHNYNGNDMCCFGKGACAAVDCTFLKNRGFVFWVVGNAVSYIGFLVPFYHLVRHSDDLFPSSDSSLLPLCTALTYGLANLAFGAVLDTGSIGPVRLQQAALTLLGVTTMCIPAATSYEGLLAISLALGVSDGLYNLLTGPVVFSLVGVNRASQALGFYFGMIALPTTLGIPLAGLMYDYLGSYTAAFYAAGATCVLGAMIMIFIPSS